MSLQTSDGSRLDGSQTALSQRRNLLFVACGHQIYVWVPAGPRQSLGRKPAMIITPVMRVPDAPGYISTHFPHGINNILVDDLGRDEILLLATDSGNVCGYLVENIFAYIESAKQRGDARPIVGPQIDPFFCESVEMSAWGLAVHKYARLIAVSANTGVITVFAFALADTDVESDDHWEGLPLSFEQNWFHIKEEVEFRALYDLYYKKRHRSRNLKLSFEGHFTNIPSVSFLNSDLDSDGMWMVSTDIENHIFVWAIWQEHGPVAERDFSDGDPLPELSNVRKRGWNVLALDPRSFRVHRSFFEACGGKVFLRQCRRGNSVLDVTTLCLNVPEIRFLFHPGFALRAAGLNEPTLPDLFDSSTRISADCLSTGGDDEDVPSTDLQAHGPNSNRESLVDSTAQNQTIPVGGQVLQQTGARSIPADSAALLALFMDLPPIHRSGTTPSNDQSEQENPRNDEGNRVVLLTNDASRIHELLNRAESDSDSDAIYDDYCFPPHILTEFPILHFSETEIRLLETPFSHHASVISAAPLRQRLPRSLQSLQMFDRFNMVKYLPEAGIVLAATQKGRVAVITLGQVAGQNYTFRINWMLPFKSQEWNSARPATPLLGIAVSPMQGFERSPDSVHVPKDSSCRNYVTFHYRPNDGDSFDFDHISGQRPASGDAVNLFSPSLYGNVPERRSFTFSESHGIADWTYMSSEPWDGFVSSRHYRVMLTYMDHTVLSYEFWYQWPDLAMGNELTTRKTDGQPQQRVATCDCDRSEHLLV